MAKPNRKPYTRRPGSNRPGAPTIMTEELQGKILAHVAAGGTIRGYCRDHRYPNQDTVFNFLASESGEKFAEQMLRARERGTHAIAEHVMEIADNPKIDPVRAKLMADVRMRLIAAWNRKSYGVRPEDAGGTRMTLGELVEASMRLAAAQGAAQIAHTPQQLIDVTPVIQTTDVVPIPAGEEPAAARERKPRRIASR